MRLRDVLYFNRSDRKALLFLLTLLVVGAGLLVLVPRGDELTAAAPADSTKVDSSLAAKGGRMQFDQGTGGVEGGEKFPFDPNTADSTAFLRLGLTPWQVRGIYKYRAAGGVFRRPEDFARLYGLTKKDYLALKPYIRIGDDYAPAAELYTPPQREATARHDSIARTWPEKMKPGERIDLNTADSAKLVRVPGVGAYFARRIESYRNWLGGFYTVDQLTEIDDFPKESIQYFFVGGSPWRKINVNKAKLGELKRHPYINYYQAKAIADYRRLRGPLHNLSELRLLDCFSADDLERLSHYVAY